MPPPELPVNPPGDEMHDFDAHDIKRLFGLSAAAIRALARAGYLRPVRRGARITYSFQDLVILRNAAAFRAARVPPAKVREALERIRSSLSPDSAYVRGNAPVAAAKANPRQLELSLDLPGNPDNLRVLHHVRRTMAGTSSAHEHFERALALEESDEEEAARAAYQASLAADPEHLEARINLGRLLHLAGFLADAECVYRNAHAPSALLSFNLAIVLEDLAREPQAIAVYHDALAHDPDMADAHFNVARLYERAGDVQASFRHLLAYRRLTSAFGI